MWGPSMIEHKYNIKSVQRIGLTNYLVEVELLTKVGFLWRKRWQSDIAFYRTYNGSYWYEESSGIRASHMKDMLDAAVRKYQWDNETKEL